MNKIIGTNLVLVDQMVETEYNIPHSVVNCQAL